MRIPCQYRSQMGISDEMPVPGDSFEVPECRMGLLIGRLIEPGEEPDQGAQVRFPEWVSGPGSVTR
jgi:hypothetical protein